MCMSNILFRQAILRMFKKGAELAHVDLEAVSKKTAISYATTLSLQRYQRDTLRRKHREMRKMMSGAGVDLAALLSSLSR